MSSACSASGKEATATARARHDEFRRLLKADTRELKRLRRQVKTYETLAQPDWTPPALTAPPPAAEPPVQTVRLTATSKVLASGRDGEEAEEEGEDVAVTPATVRRLWRSAQEAAERAAQLERDGAAVLGRLQVRPPL